MQLKLCLLNGVLPLALIACDNPESATSPGDPDRAQPMESTRALRPPPSVPVAKPGGSVPGGASAAPPDGKEREAEAEFTSVPKMKLTGDAELSETADGVRIQIEVEDAPKGKKAVHIHEKDDCSDIAGKSMGAHFDPDGKKHGLPSAAEHHLGDLGNLTVDDEGDGTLTIVVAKANLKAGDARSFLGKAIVIHEGEDHGDGESGNAGSPIACAPIKAD
ncbi:MAG: superoxide dismutase family protein [Polyangiaceae bacterium]|nr:superoxide dismutase family protein [Myxococcales bacterium]MCB9587672.1 superoxide dismutase family protein [Polyangiaceae bacterium]MCB9605530.1 superoxide dismutase family protein [Polyangiaceae bacterium]